MFDQIFTIHAFVGDVMFPLVFSLLPKRDTATYNRFFTLHRILPADTTSTFLPQELAATYTFPTAELQGCLFHYAKAIWRKTQECGLQTDYKDVPDVTKLVRREACLPLLPLNKVEDFWLYTLENAPPRDDCIKLTDYVTETWIEGPFSQPTWNHYQTEGSRTNNHLEGWHNKLKKRVGVAHPTIYKMSDEFKKEQAANEVKIEQYSDGGR
jgi:hypothetical protein